MLRTIDCVMLRVDDLDRGASFYESVFGLREVWRDETAVGMGLPESTTEVVLHTTDVAVSVHYLVDDVLAAATEYVRSGCVLRMAPFDVAIGRCAVLTDPFGNDIAILDMTKGPRPAVSVSTECSGQRARVGGLG